MIPKKIREALQGKYPISDMEILGYRVLTNIMGKQYYVSFEEETIIMHNRRTNTIRQYNLEIEPGEEE